MTEEYTPPFFLSEVPKLDGNSFSTIEAEKQKIMSTYIARGIEVHGIKEKDLIHAWSQWNSTNDEILAAQISAELEAKMGDYVNKKVTGASFEAAVKARMDSENSGEPNANNFYTQAAKEIENRLNFMIDTLMLEEPTIELAALCNCIGRKIPDARLAQKYEGKGVQLNGIGKKAQNALQKLKSQYEALKQWNPEESLGFTSEKTGNLMTPSDIAKAVGGSLSAIAGEVFYEVLVAAVAERILKEYDKIDEKTIEAFMKNGFKVSVRARQARDVSSGGSQGKPDIYWTWSENGVTLILSGSVKLRQANQDFVGKTFKGQIEYDVTIKGLMKYANELNTQAETGFKGALGAILQTKGAVKGGGYVNSIADYQAAWQEMKEQAIFMATLDKFSGTGKQNEFGDWDYADTLIINSKVIPLYLMFQDIAANGFTKATALSGSGWTWQFNNKHFKYWTQRKKYHTSADADSQLRYQNYNQMWNTIKNKKIHIDFSLSKLANSKLT